MADSRAEPFPPEEVKERALSKVDLISKIVHFLFKNFKMINF
jgi:hypothetical protein